MPKRQTSRASSATPAPRESKKRSATPPPQEPVTPDQVELLSIPEVAQRLKVSRNQVYQLIKKKGLPSCLIGDVLRVPLVKLYRWIEQQEQSRAS